MKPPAGGGSSRLRWRDEEPSTSTGKNTKALVSREPSEASKRSAKITEKEDDAAEEHEVCVCLCLCKRILVYMCVRTCVLVCMRVCVRVCMHTCACAARADSSCSELYIYMYIYLYQIPASFLPSVPVPDTVLSVQLHHMCVVIHYLQCPASATSYAHSSSLDMKALIFETSTQQYTHTRTHTHALNTRAHTHNTHAHTNTHTQAHTHAHMHTHRLVAPVSPAGLPDLWGRASGYPSPLLSTWRSQWVCPARSRRVRYSPASRLIHALVRMV